MKDEWVHLVYNHKATFYYTDQVSMAYRDFYSEYNFDFYKNGKLSTKQTSGSYNPCPQCGINLTYLNPPTPFYTNFLPGTPPAIPPGQGFLFSSFVVGAAKDVSGTGTNKFFKGWIKDIRIYISTGNLANDTVFVQNLYNNPPVFTGISESYNNQIKANTYPNPSKTGYFTITTNKFDNNTNYTIIDLSGKLIKSGKIHNEKTLIDLSENAKGIYFIKIQNKSGIKTLKLIYQ